MDIPSKLKQRFVEDCKLPIDIYTEPIFTSRLNLLDRFYNTIERYNVFLEMIKSRYTTYEVESRVIITAQNKGIATITAQSKSNPVQQKTCYIKVIDSSESDEVDSVSIEPSEINLAVGSTRQLDVTILPGNLADKRILWSTSDKSIATVSGGAVTAVYKDEKEDSSVTITAISNKDKTKTATCVVTVTNPVEVESLNFKYHQTELQMGQQEMLSISPVPSNATSADISWESSNSSIASVVDGKVVALSPGWCAITASNPKDRKICDTCYVLVHDMVPVSKVIIEYTSTDQEMHVGGQNKLNYTILPEKATEKSVVWSSTDASVLQVDSITGVFKALRAGTACIRAHAKLDTTRYGECIISVLDPVFVKDLQIDSEENELDKGQTLTLTASVHTGYGIDPSVKWLSSDENIVKVSSSDDSETQKSMKINDEDYYDDYDKVKCKIVRHIRKSSRYSSFISLNTETSWPVHKYVTNDSIYVPEMDNHTMISIKIDKPEFTPLYYYDPSIFNNISSWENVVSTIGETDNDHIIYSENLLTEVYESCGESRIQAYGRYILDDFYTTKVKPITDALGNDSYGNQLAELVYFGNDEIVVDTSRLTNIVDLDSSSRILCTNRLLKLYNDLKMQVSGYMCPHVTASKPFPMIIRLFTLYKLKTEYTEDNEKIIDENQIKGYVKNIYYEKNQPIEFVGEDICQLPMLLRSMSYEDIQENDRKFMHRGLIAKFTDDTSVHVPQISVVPSTPIEMETSSELSEDESKESVTSEIKSES